MDSVDFGPKTKLKTEICCVIVLSLVTNVINSLYLLFFLNKCNEQLIFRNKYKELN